MNETDFTMTSWQVDVNYHNLKRNILNVQNMECFVSVILIYEA